MTALSDIPAARSRSDLHVHSRYSNRPSEWILRRIGAPECYTEPRHVYDTARRRGMKFVTISDHNCIEGAEEISHLAGAFISNEITAYFPEDGCKVHILSWNITESEFDEIQRLRPNIFELRDYLHQAGIAHACAHPLYSINDRLTLDHFERLLLLFNTFEVMNGGRHRRGNVLVRTILERLSQADFEEIASRHPVVPLGTRPWLKTVCGGSDDHSGAFIAKGYTECPESTTPAEFLRHVTDGRSRAGGLDGTPLSFAHSLYTIAYQYYRDRFLSKSDGGRDLVVRVFGEIFGREQTQIGLRDRVSYYASRLTRRQEPSELEFKRMVSTEMTKLFGEDWLRDDFVATPERYEELNRRTFELSSRIANELLFQFSRKFVEKLASGSVFGSLEAISAAGPILLGIAPYMFAFAHQSRDKAFLGAVSRRFLGQPLEAEARARTAWCVDGLSADGPAARFADALMKQASVHGHDMTVLSFSDRWLSSAASSGVPDTHYFGPVGRVAIPDHESETFGFPPFLDVLEYCERRQFAEIVVGTPGIGGLAAAAAGKLLNIRMIGLYHTDLPALVRRYTDDEAMENASWRYIRWFYDQMAVVYVPSHATRALLVEKGLDPARLRVCGFGTDLERFHPDRRNPSFWQRFGRNAGPTVLCVVQPGDAQDLHLLAVAFEAIADHRPDWTVAIAGIGSVLTGLRDHLRQPNVVFADALSHLDFGTAHASADVFVLPGTADHFGDRLLDAMASGLPAIVGDRGRPSEIVEHGTTGLLTRTGHPGDLIAAIERLIGEPELRRKMSRVCRERAETSTWEPVYRSIWQPSGGLAARADDAVAVGA